MKNFKMFLVVVLFVVLNGCLAWLGSTINWDPSLHIIWVAVAPVVSILTVFMLIGLYDSIKEEILHIKKLKESELESIKPSLHFDGDNRTNSIKRQEQKINEGKAAVNAEAKEFISDFEREINYREEQIRTLEKVIEGLRLDPVKERNE